MASLLSALRGAVRARILAPLGSPRTAVALVVAVVATLLLPRVRLVGDLVVTTYADPLFYLIALLVCGVLYSVLLSLLVVVAYVAALAAHALPPAVRAGSAPYADALTNALVRLVAFTRRHGGLLVQVLAVAAVAWVVGRLWLPTTPCKLALGADLPPDAAESARVLADITEFVVYQRNREPFRPALRAQHAKSISCVRATLRLDDAVNDRVAHGLFAQGGREYSAWVRFSHSESSPGPDTSLGARGMAVKVLGVQDAGKPLSSDELESMDLLLLSSPVFFADDPSEYGPFVRAFVSGDLARWFLSNVFNQHAWRTLWAVARIFWEGRQVRQLLNWTWFSTTPSRLGPNAVKYVAAPCDATDPAIVAATSDDYSGDPNALRSAMAAALDNASACFDVYVQLQEDPCREPVEQPTVEWRTPRHHVAKLHIPKQTFLSQAQYDFCERLSFTPWHTTEVHRPIGAVNHQRRLVYERMAQLRRAYNGQLDRPVPTGNETFGPPPISADYWNCTTVAEGDTKHWQFRPYAVEPALARHLPGRVHSLVRAGQFSSAKVLRVLRTALDSASNVLSEVVVNEFDRMRHPNDYLNLFHDPSMRARIPWLAKDRLWELDSVFASQWIRGMNPMAIRRLTKVDKLPAAFDLTDEHKRYLQIEVLPAGTTVAALHSSGHLLYADYHVLTLVDPWRDAVRYPVLVLFYVHRDARNTELRPLAIQLNQTAGVDTVYLPPPREVYSKTSEARDKDRRWMTWMFARMHAASADAQVHEMVSHLGMTHLLLEPVIIGVYRQFAPTHIVHRLLKPHMRQTISINELGRRTLLNDNGYFDSITALGREGTLRLIALSWQEFNFTQRAFPLELRSRGFERVTAPGTESDPVPGFLYRDYGFLVWDALEAYVRVVIERFYASDSAVASDAAIQRWCLEVGDPLMGNVPGFPRAITSRDNLVLILTHFIFTASAQHSAVNFGQFDYYGFVPNKPMRLTRPMPAAPHDEISWEYIMAALPNRQVTFDQMTITNILSMKPSFVLDETKQDEIVLGTRIKDALELGDPLWRPEFVDDWRALMQRLRDAQSAMVTRNSENGYHYDYLYYDEIAVSIAI